MSSGGTQELICLPAKSLVDEAQPHGRAVVGQSCLCACHLRVKVLSFLAKIIRVRPVPLQ